MSQKRKCTFNEELQIKYTCFRATENSKYEAFCKVCLATVSIANKGKYDLDQHIESKKHRRAIQAGTSSQNITEFVSKRCSDLDNQVTAIELTLAFHTVKHQMSFKSTDCTSRLLKKLFNDSQKAKKLSSARTKTRALSKNVIAPYSIKTCLDYLLTNDRGTFVSISTDGSNHGNEKNFPLLLQYFDEALGIQTKIVNLDRLPNEKSETIANYIVSYLNKSNLLNKCIAYSADNCNTNFGGLSRKGENNVFKILRSEINENLIGIGCPAHIIHNSAQHGFDSLPIDIESIVLKIYNFFSIYTVRVESLKEFCFNAEIEYKQLLSHSKSRWLSLFPALERILQLFPALKSYFLSLENCPAILKHFFESELSEGYLFFAHSFNYLFYEKIKYVENEKNSVLETMNIISELRNSLMERYNNSFLPLKVQNVLNKYAEKDLQNETLTLKSNFLNCYKISFDYLSAWTDQFEKCSCFDWMNLNKIPEWHEIEKSIEFINLIKTGTVNDAKCFDQHCNLKKFTKDHLCNDDFKKLLAHQKWVQYFKSCIKDDFFSELLKICQFFFAIPGQNANVERIFSLMGLQWTNERNKMKISTVRALLTIYYNFRNVKCEEFFDICLQNKDLLKQAQMGKNTKRIQKMNNVKD